MRPVPVPVPVPERDLRRNTKAVSLVFAHLLLTGALNAKPLFEEQTLFQRGENGYHTYRIPALVVTNRGTALGFAEARKNDRRDHGDIDLALKRSTDGGLTWSTMEIVADDGIHTMGNPCPVVARKSETIWLPLCRNNKQVLMMKSTDDGKSWSDPIDITKNATDPKWHWFGTGPGHGIQLESGRLVVPCWADVTPKLGEIQLSYVFFSDDHGKSWQLGAPLDANASDECEVVELRDRSLYMNARSRQGKRRRAVATSVDGGKSWSPVTFDARLPEPSCQGSLVRFTDTRRFRRNRILLSTPANPKARADMTVRLSYDECKSWPVSKLLHEGGSAYSDLAIANDGNILLLYEADGYAKITVARFNLEWLTNGEDSLQQKKKK